MKNLKLLTLICAVFVSTVLPAAENDSTAVRIDKTSVGIGGGMDFGGFGANFMYCPSKSFGLFAGAGYALAGVGVNAGVKLRIIPKSPAARHSFYGMAMYGYNAAIAVSGATQYNKLFYGPTLGFGVDFRSTKRTKGYWSLALILPIRSSDVKDYMDDLEANHGVEFKTGLFPIGVSVGYRFILN